MKTGYNGAREIKAGEKQGPDRIFRAGINFIWEISGESLQNNSNHTSIFSNNFEHFGIKTVILGIHTIRLKFQSEASRVHKNDFFAIYQIISWIFFSDIVVMWLEKSQGKSGWLEIWAQGCLWGHMWEMLSYTMLCFWHLANLSQWTYLPKIALATRYVVSVPTHMPSNMEITYPAFLAFTDVLKAETYLLQIIIWVLTLDE